MGNLQGTNEKDRGKDGPLDEDGVFGWCCVEHKHNRTRIAKQPGSTTPRIWGMRGIPSQRPERGDHVSDVTHQAQKEVAGGYYSHHQHTSSHQNHDIVNPPYNATSSPAILSTSADSWKTSLSPFTSPVETENHALSTVKRVFSVEREDPHVAKYLSTSGMDSLRKENRVHREEITRARSNANKRMREIRREKMQASDVDA